MDASPVPTDLRTRLQPYPDIVPRKLRAALIRWAATHVQTAIKRGELPRLDGSIACADCGALAIGYEHRDYRRPLEVEPICKRCNARRGPALPFVDTQRPVLVGGELMRIIGTPTCDQERDPPPKIHELTFTSRERREAFIAAVGQALSLEEIGQRLGFSHERARQLLHKFDLYEQWKSARRASTINRRAASVNQHGREWWTSSDGRVVAGFRDIAQVAGMPVTVAFPTAQGVYITADGLPVHIHYAKTYFRTTGRTLYYHFQRSLGKIYIPRLARREGRS